MSNLIAFFFSSVSCTLRFRILECSPAVTQSFMIIAEADIIPFSHDLFFSHQACIFNFHSKSRPSCSTSLSSTFLGFFTGSPSVWRSNTSIGRSACGRWPLDPLWWVDSWAAVVGRQLGRCGLLLLALGPLLLLVVGQQLGHCGLVAVGPLRVVGGGGGPNNYQLLLAFGSHGICGTWPLWMAWQLVLL